MGSRDAIELYEEMSEFARARGDRALELQSLLLRGKMHAGPTTAFDPLQVKALSAQANALAIELGDPASQAHALWNEQMLYLYNNQFNDSIRVGEQAAELARQVAHRELLAYILGDLSRAYGQSGQVDKFLPPQTEALAIWRELDNQPMVADSLMMSGSHALRRGEYALAIRELEASIQISRNIGSKVSLLSAGATLVILYVEQGEYTSGLALLNEVLDAVHEITGGLAKSLPSAFSCWVYATIGVFERAAEFADQARAQLAGTASGFLRQWAWTMLARGYSASGDINAARAALSQAEITSADESGGPAVMNGVLALGECLLAEQNYSELSKIMSEQFLWLQRSRFHQTLPEVLLLRAQAERALGEREKGFASLERAGTEAEALQARTVLTRIYPLLSSWERERGNDAQAEHYMAQARATVKYIAAHTPPEFRDAYLRLPHVRKILEVQS
jgi:tetratricopeptide (TPR) repeat protein